MRLPSCTPQWILAGALCLKTLRIPIFQEKEKIQERLYQKLFFCKMIEKLSYLIIIFSSVEEEQLQRQLFGKFCLLCKKAIHKVL